MNRLATETSPYLRQHANNPVDWHPWGEEALRLARAQDKPILLSIGYSACHWCHVMAHESFEHPETAALMNELFVNIKVDREERPDLDRVYQTAHQLLAQRPGGWPLTVFLMPDDQTPFFAGTYFPREARFGMPAFREVLKRLRAAYDEQRDALRTQNRNLRELLERLNATPASNDIALSETPLKEARRQLEADFDPDNGGFGGAPKFPHPSNLEFLLRHADASGDQPAMRMLNFTLQQMAQRGLYDHLGGGFFRYCVDAHWDIPHFEKMLYDNGPLLGLYANAWRITREPRYRRVVEETAVWLEREMRSPEGGFYSTLDADSDGREGGFYVWTQAAVASALEQHSDSALLQKTIGKHFGLDQRPNFDRVWHLVVAKDLDALAAEQKIPTADVRALIERAKQTLFEAREKRNKPNRDEKILASWNALTIRGLAQAARAMENPNFMRIASDAVNFIREHLWKNGRLLTSFMDGKARFPAYLDDYAFLIDALMEMLEARWHTQHLEFAIELADTLLEHFEDRGNGGFFFTAGDHESLLFRPKPFSDESTPSGNGVAARALWRLGQLLAEPKYLEASARTLRASWSELKRAPSAHASLLDTLRDQLHAGATVILRGEEELMAVWREKISNGPARNHHVYCIPASENHLPRALADKLPQGECVAYVCRGFTCSPPVTDRDGLHAALQEQK